MTRHPDAGALAEFREGLLGRWRSARIRAHLSGCPRCASLDAGLAEVSTLLASSPAPRMPGHVVARLDSALAAEAGSRRQAGDTAPAGAGNGAAGPTADGAAPQADGRPAPSRGPGHSWRRTRRPARSRRPAVLGAAAAALVVLGGTAYGLVSLGQQPNGTAASSGSATQRPGKSRTGTGTATGPALGPNVRTTAPLYVVRSGTDYQPGRLASQAKAALTRYGAGHAGVRRAASLRSCVMQITHGLLPGLLDMASYRGQPATIVIKAPSAGSPGQVWVVRQPCSGQHREVLAHATLPGPG